MEQIYRRDGRHGRADLAYKGRSLLLMPSRQEIRLYPSRCLNTRPSTPLRAGDNIFICKSHLSMDLSNPYARRPVGSDKLPATGGTDDYFIDFPVRSVRVQGTGNRGQRTGIILAFIPCGAKGFPSDSGRDTGGGAISWQTGYGGNGVIEAPAASRDLAKFIMRGEKDTFIGRLGV